MAAPGIVPHPRLDVVVERPTDGARQRLTTYTGLLVCGARTERFGHTTWGALTRFEHSWALPDSLPYLVDRVAGAQVVATISPRSLNETFDVVRGAASIVPDPDRVHAWLHLDLEISARVGSVGAYRVEVLVPTDAVDGPRPG